MLEPRLLSLSLASLLFTLPTSSAMDSTPNTGDQLQGFTFAYTTSNLVLPITYTCPTPLTLTQITPTNKGGPDPQAPYTMIMFIHEQLMDGAGKQYERLYARSMDVGNMDSVQNIQHPLMNGTQFIGCVWSKNGVSGGCQDLFTVVPSPVLTQRQYANTTSGCRSDDKIGSWVTPLDKQLDVDVVGTTGSVSQNAWPASCSDLQFIPKNGTAPYTLVIAPAAHPPINITSSDADDNKMNYTIRLSHGQAFMAGVFDADGNSFAFGPLHAGDSNDVKCLGLAPGQNAGGSSNISTGAFAGGVVGAFVVGALGALLIGWLIHKRQKKQKVILADSQELLHDPYADPRPAAYRDQSATSSTFPKSTETHTTPYLTRSPYLDLTPPLDNTPSTLYDPVIPGQGSGSRDRNSFYPVTPGEGSSSYNRDHRNTYSSPYGDNYAGNGDFAPGQRHDRDASSSSRGDHHYSISSAGNMGSGNKRHSGGSRLAGDPSSPDPRRDSGPDGSPNFRNRGRRDSAGSGEGRVYVVHSDAGNGEEYHIRLPAGRSRVIEVPPDYQDNGSSAPPTSPHDSLRSPQLPPQDGAPPNTTSPPPPAPQHPLRLVTSQESGLSQRAMSADEIRARAEAALAEKGRGQGPPPPR